MNFPRLFGACLFLLALALMWEIVDSTDLRIAEKFLSDKFAAKTKTPRSSGPPQLQDAEAIDEGKPVTRVAKAPEVIAQEVDLLCKGLQKKLESNQIVTKFARVDLKFHEKRLKEMTFQHQLKSCFSSETTAHNRVELDIFTADFRGQNSADIIEIQLSVFDKKSRNKIFETGAQFELSKVVELPTKAEANPAN